ncbi:MAG: MFS transporter [Gemmatimonadaceae bacterium]
MRMQPDIPETDPPSASPIDTARGWRAPVRERASWAIYDFATTIFSMNVGSLYFSVWLVFDLGASNTEVALGNGLASCLVFLSVPLLGAISDARRRRVPWVIWFTALSCVATALIGILGQTVLPLYGTDLVAGAIRPDSYHVGGSGLWLVLAAFVIANYAHQAALPFYNAMLPDLVPPTEYGRLSGIGAAVAYSGTIVGLLLVAPFVDGALPLLGAIPGQVVDLLRTLFPFTAHGGRVSTFVPTAVFVAVFSIPLLAFCRDRHPAPPGTPIPWGGAARSVLHVVRDARRYPGVIRFVLASFIYQDAIGTIIGFMALYAVEAMGFEHGTERTMFLVLTVPAIVGGYVFGRLVDRYGPKRTLVGVIASWFVLLIGLIFVPTRAAFWVVGGLIGFIFGGVSTAERPLLLTLIPEAEAGRFFSLMLLSARAAAVLGPLVWGVTVDGLRPSAGKEIAYRAAVGTVAAFMLVALIVLWGVPDRSIRRAES